MAPRAPWALGVAWARLMVLGKERSRPIWPVSRRWNPKGVAVEGDGKVPHRPGAWGPGSWYLLVANAELRTFLREKRALGGGGASRQAKRATWTCGSR